MTSLAAMALFDGDAEVSADQLNALITATGNTVEAYWPSLFASMLTPTLAEVIFSRGGGCGGGDAPAGAAAAGGDDAPAAKEEKPKEEEVDALAGGMDMFGGEEGGGDY